MIGGHPLPRICASVTGLFGHSSVGVGLPIGYN